MSLESERAVMHTAPRSWFSRLYAAIKDLKGCDDMLAELDDYVKSCHAPTVARDLYVLSMNLDSKIGGAALLLLAWHNQRELFDYDSYLFEVLCYNLSRANYECWIYAANLVTLVHRLDYRNDLFQRVKRMRRNLSTEHPAYSVFDAAVWGLERKSS